MMTALTVVEVRGAAKFAAPADLGAHRKAVMTAAAHLARAGFELHILPTGFEVRCAGWPSVPLPNLAAVHAWAVRAGVMEPAE